MNERWGTYTGGGLPMFTISGGRASTTAKPQRSHSEAVQAVDNPVSIQREDLLISLATAKKTAVPVAHYSWDAMFQLVQHGAW